MTGYTHSLIGGAIGLEAEALHPFVVPALFPALGQARFDSALSLLVGGAVLVLLGAFVARVPDLDLRLRLKHRGVTHSLLATVVAGAVVYTAVQLWMPAAALELGLVTAAAFLSHLIADCVNPTPVALLWPLPAYRPGWLPAAREKSLPGKAVEGIVWVLILGLVAGRVYQLIHR